VLIAAVYVDQRRRAAALRGGGKRPKIGDLLSNWASGRQTVAARE
jgi:hypothetical protein